MKGYACISEETEGGKGQPGAHGWYGMHAGVFGPIFGPLYAV